jgi:hypothetical protein
MGINQSRPECVADACLNQVIGYTNNNGIAQYQSCVAQFGAAQVTVVRVPLAYLQKPVTLEQELTRQTSRQAQRL